MSIERGHSAGVHAHRAAHAAHGKASAPTADADAAGGGFLALLSALDSGASDAVLGDQDLDKDKDAPTRVAVLADPALAGAAGLDPAAASADAAAAAAGVLAAALLASQSGRAQGSSRAAVEGASTGAADVTKIGAGASSAALAKAAGAASEASSDAQQSLVAANTAVTARASEYASVFEQLQNRLAAKSAADETLARLDAAAASNGTPAVKPPSVGTAGESRVERSDRANALMATMALARQGASSTEALTGKSEVAVQRASESASAASVNVPEPGWLHRDFTPTVQYDAAVGTVDASQPAPESQVADQVSYWITQGIRNAELTIGGGAGSEPVQVSISMSGNEAQVDFRTEHAHTRAMLNDSIVHLEDLLQSQGMSLSGVSVGSSGADASGGQNERARPGAGARSAAVSPVATGAADTPTVRAPKGAVDLFV